MGVILNIYDCVAFCCNWFQAFKLSHSIQMLLFFTKTCSNRDGDDKNRRKFHENEMLSTTRTHKKSYGQTKSVMK